MDDQNPSDDNRPYSELKEPEAPKEFDLPSGKYTVIDSIAAGTFGLIYLVELGGKNRRFVIKEICTLR